MSVLFVCVCVVALGELAAVAGVAGGTASMKIHEKKTATTITFLLSGMF